MNKFDWSKVEEIYDMRRGGATCPQIRDYIHKKTGRRLSVEHVYAKVRYANPAKSTKAKIYKAAEYLKVALRVTPVNIINKSHLVTRLSGYSEHLDSYQITAAVNLLIADGALSKTATENVYKVNTALCQARTSACGELRPVGSLISKIVNNLEVYNG